MTYESCSRCHHRYEPKELVHLTTKPPVQVCITCLWDMLEKKLTMLTGIETEVEITWKSPKKAMAESPAECYDE